MDPGGITGGNEKRRLVFLQYRLWPLQIHIYLFIYVCVCMQVPQLCPMYLWQLYQELHLYMLVMLHLWFGTAGWGL